MLRALTPSPVSPGFFSVDRRSDNSRQMTVLESASFAISAWA
jgi:hypothetical protein